MLPIRCPACGSKNVRSSYSQTFFERLAKFLGVFKLRCRDCDCRFSRAIWDVFNMFYARCPRCYNLELSVWQPQYYRPPGLQRLKLKFGGRPRRCEKCRNNFVSFRPCKIRFVRRKPKSSTTQPLSAP